MPGAAVGLRGGVAERAVDAPAVLRRSAAVHRRPHERVVEAHLRTELDQAGVGSRRPGAGVDPQQGGRAPEQERVADRLGRRDEQQQPGRLRQRLEPLLIARLDAAGQRGLAVEPEAARQLGRRPAARELEQGERVAACLGHDAIAHALVERTRHHGLEQRPRIAGFQPADDELVQLAEAPLAGALAHGEDQPGRLRLQAARHEGERLG